VINGRTFVMERFVSLLAWTAFAVALIAAFLVRHEPRPGNAERNSRRAARSGSAART
jgi:hypothetical protein